MKVYFREVEGQTEKCTFNSTVEYTGMLLTEDFDLNDIDIPFLKDTAKKLLKSHYRLDVNIMGYNVYVTDSGRFKYKVNAVKHTKYLNRAENITDISIMLGMICGELSLTEKKQYEVGDITIKAFCLFGENVSYVTTKPFFFKENKNVEEYVLDDFK